MRIQTLIRACVCVCSTKSHCYVRLNRGSIRPRVRLHGEVNSQCCLIDVGNDDVSCWHHLPETFHTFLDTNRRNKNCEQRLITIKKSSLADVFSYLFRVQLVQSLHMQRKVISVVFLQFIIKGAGVQPEHQTGEMKHDEKQLKDQTKISNVSLDKTDKWETMHTLSSTVSLGP